MSGAFGVTYDDGVKDANLDKVLFKSEALVYKVVKASLDLYIGFLKENVSFCRKTTLECDAKHGGEGSARFKVEALALANTAKAALGPPLLESESLETDPLEDLLSSGNFC